jgi:cold shock CspA family protein
MGCQGRFGVIQPGEQGEDYFVQFNRLPRRLEGPKTLQELDAGIKRLSQ